MLKRVLVGIGPEPASYAAIRHAAELGQAHGAELCAALTSDVELISDALSPAMGAGEALRRLENEQRRAEAQEMALAENVRRFESTCAALGVAHRLDARPEDLTPWDHFAQRARYNDLMVVGHAASFVDGTLGYERRKAGEVLVRLISAGVRPLLAVAPEHRPIRRALVCYSGSMESAKAMKRFIQLRPFPDVAMKILTVGKGERGAPLVAEAAAYCQAHGYAPETEALSGSPQRRILPAAEAWGADVIVMGNSARSLMLRNILGETALHVMRYTDRPLFLGQ